MTPDQTAKQLTQEIINEFMLPEKMCFLPIYTRFRIAIGVGFDLRHELYNNKKAKAVLQLDALGRVMMYFPSLKHAARAVDRSKTRISAACRGETKTCAGYGWRFFDQSEYCKYSQIKRRK